MGGYGLQFLRGCGGKLSRFAYLVCVFLCIVPLSANLEDNNQSAGHLWQLKSSMQHALSLSLSVCVCLCLCICQILLYLTFFHLVNQLAIWVTHAVSFQQQQKKNRPSSHVIWDIWPIYTIYRACLSVCMPVCPSRCLSICCVRRSVKLFGACYSRTPQREIHIKIKIINKNSWLQL